jgi:hypothetical protein
MIEKKMTNNKLFLIPLVFFALSAGLGLLMRYGQVYGPVFAGSKNLLQAHSHVTFLGWGFLAVLLLIHDYFEIPFDKKYRGFWSILVLTVMGLLIFFPIYGYTLIPISFLVLFLLASYFYLGRLLNGIKGAEGFDYSLLRFGIYYYFLSSLAVWFVPVVLLKFGKNILYYDLVYFYLHFLYNGFFVFVLFSLFIKSLLLDRTDFEYQHIKKGLILLNLAVVPTFFLSVYWHTSNSIVVAIGAAGAIIQVLALLFLSKGLVRGKTAIFRPQLIYLIAAIFSIKIVLQFLSVHPALAQKAIGLKPFFVVGYLHLFTIGFLSLIIFWLMKLKTSIANMSGLVLLILGFVVTEVLLFYQGSAIWFNLPPVEYFYKLLLWGSFSMFLGIMLILLGRSIKR